MASVTAMNVSEYDPYNLCEKRISTSSASSSVEYDTDLKLKLNAAKLYTTNHQKSFTRFDHLRAIFCAKRRGKTAIHGLEDQFEPKARKVRSPWILPVYVISLQRDEQRHLIRKEAKCTIDTGNIQGNIVSKAFAIDELGYSEANFQKLTKAEEEGGTGITGHRLVPSGAIYLTWYHDSSTRVFRDMRFLVSEYPMYELVIGAHSIQEQNILSVPNLMVGGRINYNPTITSNEFKQYQASLNAQKQETSELRLKRAKLRGGEKHSQYADHSVKMDESLKKEKIFEKEVDDEYKKVLEALICTADEEDDTVEATKLRQHYKESYGKEAPAPVVKPKSTGKGKSHKTD